MNPTPGGCSTPDCSAPGWWRIERCDAIVSWACNIHLAGNCMAMQRDFEVTELVVTLAAKQREWNELAAELDAIIEAAA